MSEEHKHHHHDGSKSTITVSKLTLWKSISAILGLLLIISIYTGGFSFDAGSSNSGTVAAPTAAQPSAPQPSAAPVDMAEIVDDDAVKGDADAPVTIVEWSDFECPFCGRFYSETLGQIKSEYVDTGKVKLVYRDFPLSFHAQAQKAAEAAECAGEQGKFWEMHDLLFESGVSGGVASFKQYASDIGLDTADFNSCLDSGAMASEIQQDMQDGIAAGITGTPGFIINGRLVSGAQPFANFKQVIEAALAE